MDGSSGLQGRHEKSLELHGSRSTGLGQPYRFQLSTLAAVMISSPHPVPATQDSREVGVETVVVQGMMTTVHPWGDQCFLQPVLNGHGDANIAVMELGRKVQKDVKGRRLPRDGPQSRISRHRANPEMSSSPG
jgi:hypothetical protein